MVGRLVKYYIQLCVCVADVHDLPWEQVRLINL